MVRKEGKGSKVYDPTPRTELSDDNPRKGHTRHQSRILRPFELIWIDVVSDDGQYRPDGCVGVAR